jgi:hypothetical protein
MLMQESDLKHFHEPRPDDEDTYIVVGLDTNDAEDYIITSRGYGCGQYTLFHHPPRGDEVVDFMLDVGRNVSKAMTELREKFDRFVAGATSGTRADDRVAEVGHAPLRLCKYSPGDERFLRDCSKCAVDAGLVNIRAGETRVFEGADLVFEPTGYYEDANYVGVPQRKKFECDWPYAMRRYNGSGINSYHYQARVLQNLLTLTLG